MVARTLGIPKNRINCHVKRVGGAFGGKASKPGLLASVAAVAAQKWVDLGATLTRSSYHWSQQFQWLLGETLPIWAKGLLAQSASLGEVGTALGTGRLTCLSFPQQGGFCLTCLLPFSSTAKETRISQQTIWLVLSIHWDISKSPQR
jgi:hypothetical protein